MDAFATPQWSKSWAVRSRAVGLGFIVVQRFSEYSKHESWLALRGPTQGEIAGDSLLGPRRATRVSFWTAAYGAARQWALAITVFRSGHSLGQHFL